MVENLEWKEKKKKKVFLRVFLIVLYDKIIGYFSPCLIFIEDQENYPPLAVSNLVFRKENSRVKIQSIISYINARRYNLFVVLWILICVCIIIYILNILKRNFFNVFCFHKIKLKIFSLGLIRNTTYWFITIGKLNKDNRLN